MRPSNWFGNGSVKCVASPKARPLVVPLVGFRRSASRPPVAVAVVVGGRGGDVRSTRSLASSSFGQIVASSAAPAAAASSCPRTVGSATASKYNARPARNKHRAREDDLPLGLDRAVNELGIGDGRSASIVVPAGLIRAQHWQQVPDAAAWPMVPVQCRWRF